MLCVQIFTDLGKKEQTHHGVVRLGKLSGGKIGKIERNKRGRGRTQNVSEQSDDEKIQFNYITKVETYPYTKRTALSYLQVISMVKIHILLRLQSSMGTTGTKLIQKQKQ